MEERIIERLIERVEIFATREISDNYKKIDENVEFYRDFIKSINSEFDGYEILDNLEHVKEEMDQLCRSIRDNTDSAIELIRNKGKEETRSEKPEPDKK